ncbi:MAG: DNA translocase FtsK, partial [Bacteriovoracaceae bacterium]
MLISSSDQTVSYVSYYLSSIFSMTAYYVGAWIIVPFVSYFLIYFTLLNKREKEFDMFIPVLLAGFFFALSFIFFPEFIGKGLLHRSYKYLDTYIGFALALVFGFFVALITMRGAFFESLKIIQTQLGNLGSSLIRMIGKALGRTRSLYGYLFSRARATEFKSKAIKLLKEGVPKTKRVSPPQTFDQGFEETNHIPQKQEQDLSRPLPKKESASQDNKALDFQSSEANKTTEEKTSSEKPSNEKTQREAKEVQEAFFQSKELIDCISPKTSHYQVQGPDKDYFDTICSTIENKLMEFKLKGQIINILKGPVVDTFELELGEGIRASKVKTLEDDIGLALNGAPIRVVYPLKGKSTIGIEVPRNPRELIYLDEVLQTEVFNQSNKRLPIAMGKDAFGEVAVVDLAGMPHMLVAGATGAGKSVFINTLLVSLIIKKSPKELRLILIDPKQLELALFESLPHLMLPVITEAKTAAISLLWAVEEMERRYTILKEMGV